MQKKLTCAAKAGHDIAHPPSCQNLALNIQNSTGTNFSSGATGSGNHDSASSNIVNNALKKNNYLNQLQSELGNLYAAPSSKATNPPGLSLNPSVGSAVHREPCQVAPPKVISCTKPNKQAQRFDYSSIQALMNNLKMQSAAASATSKVPSQLSHNNQHSQNATAGV